MAKLTTYFVSLASYEFKHGKHGYDDSMWEEGSVWNSDYLEEEVQGIFTSLEDARKELETFGKTSMRDYGRYFRIEEYAIVERVYDLDSVFEDYDGDFTNTEDFLSALRKSPWDFGEYEIMEESEDIYDYSPREFEVEFTIDSEKRISKTFRTHAEAEEYQSEMWDELDKTGKVVDSEISY